MSEVPAVTFSSTPATIVSNSDATITVTTPPGTAGAVQVAVTTVAGPSSALNYTYVAVPVVTGMSPSQGPSGGGTVVTISGAGLAGTTSVTFNGVAGTSLSVNQAGTQITVTTPPGTAGTATVVVTNPGGTATVPGGFSYTDATALTATPAVIRPSGLLQFTIPSVSVTLTDQTTHSPLAGRTITFTLNTLTGPLSLGSATTGANGTATRTNISVPATAVTAASYTAAFAGDTGHLPSTTTATVTFTPL